jgi:hypothetical protein
MIEALKSFAMWVYHWITVIAGIVVGLATFALPLIGDLLSFLDVFGPIDLTRFGLSPTTAATITSGIAAAKGIVAWWTARQAAKPDPDYSADM